MAIDFDAILNAAVVDTFGEADGVTYDPLASQPGEAAVTIAAVFDREHELILDEMALSELSGPGHATTAPVLSLRRSALAARPRKGDRVTIGEETFDVWSVHPDSTGMLDLILREVE